MKNKFSSIRYFLLAGVGITLLFISCKKSWLTPKPLSLYTPENAYTTPEALQDAVVACEKNLRYEFYGDWSPILTQLIFSDECIEASGGPGNQDLSGSITPDAIVSSSGNTNATKIYWYWDQSYARLKYANTVLAYIDVPKWDTTKADQKAKRNALIGSAYFFRAYTFYELVNSFGDVPYAGWLLSSPKLDFQTVDRKVILEEMKKELEFAVQWVPDDVPKGQVTNGACLHMLAKIDLALGDFDGAIAASSKLINGGKYHLMTSRFGQDANDPSHNVIWDLHRPANKALPQNTEGLMYVIDLDGYKTIGADFGGGIQSMRNFTPCWYQNIKTPAGNPGASDQVAGIATPQCVSMGRGIGRGRGTWHANHEIWVNDPGDYRHAKGNWVEMSDYVYNNPDLKGKDTSYGKPMQLYSATGQLLVSDTLRSWYGWPYYKLFIPDNENNPPKGGHTPWYVFRLAETYLIRAEAYWWKGNLSAAAADINVVRARANAKPIESKDVNMATILDERTRELAYESPRKVELTRISYLFAQTGKADEKGRTYKMSDFSTNNYWYNRIMDVTYIYNKGVRAAQGTGDLFTISKYMVLWPIPQSAIDANIDGHINQNVGYNGAESNQPPLESLPTP